MNRYAVAGIGALLAGCSAQPGPVPIARTEGALTQQSTDVVEEISGIVTSSVRRYVVSTKGIVESGEFTVVADGKSYRFACPQRSPNPQVGERIDGPVQLLRMENGLPVYDGCRY